MTSNAQRRANKKYYELHKSEVRAQQHEYNILNRDKKALYDVEYRKNYKRDPEKEKIYRRTYYEKHRAEILDKSRKRYFLKTTAPAEAFL